MKKLLVIVLMAIGFWTVSLRAQTRVQGLINEDLILEAGTYIVEYNVKITGSATLFIEAGVEILFNPGTSVLVEGGLVIEGEKGRKVLISSVDKENEGIGFEINGISDTEIIISHAIFSEIIKPLKFTRNWRRRNVSINNSKFENIITGEAAIEIQEADNFISDNIIPFVFSKNRFCFNQSNINIQDLESDVLDLDFKNNLIINNYYKGFERGGSYNTPVFSTYNKRNKQLLTAFKNNSIFQNYLINDQNDTIISEINFGIKGNAQNFDIPENFWGEKRENDISAGFDHFVNNNTLPLLNFSPFLEQPTASAPAHIWKLKIEDKLFHFRDNLPKKNVFFVELFFNRRINGGKDNINLKFCYYDEESNLVINKNITEYNFVNSYNPEVIQLMISDKIFAGKTNGYLIINGIEDISGEKIMEINIGKNGFNVFQEKRRIKEENVILQQIIDIEDQLKSLINTGEQPEIVEKSITDISSQLESARNMKGVDNIQFRRITEMFFELDSIRLRNTYKIINIKLDSLKTRAGKRSKLRWEFQRLESELDSIQSSTEIKFEDLKQNVNMISIQVDQLENLMKVFKQFEPVNGNFDIGFQYGNAFYYGDLSTERFWDSKYTYLSLGGSVKYYIDNHWAVKLNYYNFDIGMYSPSLGSFRSRHNDLSLMAEYTILPLDIYSFSPVLSTGFKAFRSDRRNVSGENISPGFSIPLSVGIKVPAFKNWVFGFHFEINKPVSDNIDYYKSAGYGDYYFLGFFEVSRLLR